MHRLEVLQQRSLPRVWILRSPFNVIVEARSVRFVTKLPIYAHYRLRRRMPLVVCFHGYLNLAEWGRRGGLALCLRDFAITYLRAVK